MKIFFDNRNIIFYHFAMTRLSTSLFDKFGLHALEQEIYLALVALGSGTVTEIAKKTNKGRSLVYFHVRHLKERGLIEESRRKSVLRYIPKSADEVAQLLQSWVDDFREVVPLLKSLRHIQTETPAIEVIESKKGFFGIYEEISSLPTGSVFRVLEGKTAMQGEMNLLSSREWQRFFTRLKERRIKTKAIFTKEALEIPSRALSPENRALLQARQWDIRVIGEGLLPFQNMLFLYGDKAAFLFPGTSLVVTLKHQEIAQSLQIMFDGLFTMGMQRETPLK